MNITVKLLNYIPDLKKEKRKKKKKTPRKRSMKLLNPRGNMIKMNFRTAKSVLNITNSLSLTD